jgi:hypothetical protein
MVIDFPVPARMSLTKLSLVGKNFFPARESLLSDNPAEDGKINNFFYSLEEKYISGAACQPAKVQLCVRVRGMHAQLALPAWPACSAGQPACQPIPPAPK